MTGLVFVVLAVYTVTTPEGRAVTELQAAYNQAKRLAAGVVIDPSLMGVRESETRPPLRERLKQLHMYCERFNQKVLAGDVTGAEYSNYFQVARDFIDAGIALTKSPEEALCWQRLGLDMASAQLKLAAIRSRARTEPLHVAAMAQMQYELFTARYQLAQAKCVEKAR